MKRREFIAGASAAALLAGAKPGGKPVKQKMPVVFTAHGSPFNALNDNAFTRHLEKWSSAWPRPRAIVMASAHWMEPGLALTTGRKLDTVHDFYGFPQEMYDIRYPATGAPEVADRVRALLEAAGLPSDGEPARGLDHGAWAPLMRIYPKADVPVVQLSLHGGESLAHHLAVGRALRPLRDEGVLVMGSGNLVHNLGRVNFGDRDAPVAGWSQAFDRWVKERVEKRDFGALASLDGAPDPRLAHPTLEHYVPLVVCAGAAVDDARVSFPFEGFEHASISMRCVTFS
jgi:4,5-DOPA dioxygenase extradiol